MSNSPDVRHILVIEDQKSKRNIHLTENTYSIGRDPNSSIIIYDRQVSRHHATLLKITDYQNDEKEGTYRIIDGNLQGKKSTNGLLVNGKYVLSHELKHGDLIRFGSGAKASYHIISTASEVELLKAADRGDKTTLLTVPPLPTPTLTIEEQREEKQTAIFHAPQDKRAPQADVNLGKSSLAEFSPNPIIEIDFDGNITYVNPVANIKFPDLPKLKLQHPIVRGLLNPSFQKEGTSFVREIEINNSFFEQHIHYLPESKVVRSYIFDITKYKQIENQLNLAKDRYLFLTEQTSEGIFLVDVNSKKILESNLGFCDMLKCNYDDIIGKTIYQIISIDREIIDHELEQVKENKSCLVEESLYRCKDGNLLSVEARISRARYGEQDIFCFAVRDISERKNSQETMQYQAFHDPITNLPNRKLFNKQLSIALSNAQKNQTLLAVMFLDLDSFKNVNNTLGHSIGDQLLQSFGQRLLSCLRTGDIVARWGGDEFTLLLPRIRNSEDTVKLAQRIFDELKQPFTIQGHQLQIKTSIGIAIYPQDGEDEETLLKNADAALARTKQQGKNNYQFYTPTMGAEAELLLKLETALNKALDRREFSLYYQPQIKISTGEVTGMEALLRWELPEIGLIPPSKFITLAEKTDLILQIGKWVLQTACEQNRQWQGGGLPPIPVAVNLSCREFQQPNLVAVVAKILEKTRLDPQWLELEITEKTLRHNLQVARQIFQDCQNLGMRIVLDDFGQGFSSLGYLNQFPFRTLKISQCFIRDLRGTAQETALISALITLGKGFNLRVIAEGVETEQQLELLQSLNCEQVQGYLYSRPLKASEATQFLTEHCRPRV